MTITLVILAGIGLAALVYVASVVAEWRKKAERK